MNKSEAKSLIKSLVIVAVLTTLYLGYQKYLDIQPQDYAIAVFEKKFSPAKGGDRASFIYFVDGIEYKASLNYNKVEDIVLKQKKFLVEYPENFKGRGIILHKIPVPDSVESPINGWDDKPNFNY